MNTQIENFLALVFSPFHGELLFCLTGFTLPMIGQNSFMKLNVATA
jgi:hypothetical protein